MHRVAKRSDNGLANPTGSTASSMVGSDGIHAGVLANTKVDDLPEIRKNIEQGFKETQKTVTNWISNFTKKLDSGEMEEYDRYGNVQYTGRQPPPQQRQNFGPSQSDQMYGIRKSAEQRRSADHNRYDADNRVIGDDFAKLELRDNEGMLDAPCMQTAANKSQGLAHDRRVVQPRTPTSSSPHRYPHPRAAPLTKSMPSTVTHHPTTRAARANRAARNGSPSPPSRPTQSLTTMTLFLLATAMMRTRT
jgi:hypothetical protein